MKKAATKTTKKRVQAAKPAMKAAIRKVLDGLLAAGARLPLGLYPYEGLNGRTGVVEVTVKIVLELPDGTKVDLPGDRKRGRRPAVVPQYRLRPTLRPIARAIYDVLYGLHAAGAYLPKGTYTYRDERGRLADVTLG